MKETTLLLASGFFLALAPMQQTHAGELYDYKIPRESSDWCNIMLSTKPANGRELPLVLLVGDSITSRYSGEVRAALSDKAYTSMLATSKAVGDPALLDEIRLVLRQNRYAVIHFNFGLHGGIAGYRQGFPEMLDTIRRYAPEAKLIWTTTTPCQQADGGPDKNVIERNKIAAEHIAKAGLAVDDLYSLVANHSGKLWDQGGVHYLAEGTALQSKQVAEAIALMLPSLPNEPESKSNK